MTRWRASGIHLLLSALLGVCVLALLFFVWYPGPLFRATGGEKLLLLIVGIDVVAGPLLTLLVFNPKKRLLKLDLTIIAVIQIAFLAYGLTTMTVSRPAYIAFAVDRFEVVAANGLSAEDQAEAVDPRYRSVGWSGPEFVFVEMPTDPAEYESVMKSGFAGKDIEKFPKYYRPYEEHADKVVKRGWPLSLLKGRDEGWDLWLEAVEREHGADRTLFVPLRAKLAEMAVVIDKDSGEPLDYLEIDPWSAIKLEQSKRAKQAEAAAGDQADEGGADAAAAGVQEGSGESAAEEGEEATEEALDGGSEAAATGEQ